MLLNDQTEGIDRTVELHFYGVNLDIRVTFFAVDNEYKCIALKIKCGKVTDIFDEGYNMSDHMPIIYVMEGGSYKDMSVAEALPVNAIYLVWDSKLILEYSNATNNKLYELLENEKWCDYHYQCAKSV